MVGNLVWSGSCAFSVVRIVTLRGFSRKKKGMSCHTCGVLEITVRFLFWSRRWYGGIEFVLKQQAALFWALTSSFLLFLFCPVFKGYIYHSLQYCVLLCQKSSSWCLAKSTQCQKTLTQKDIWECWNETSGLYFLLDSCFKVYTIVFLFITYSD